MKDDQLYLGHILEAADRILSYGERGEEAFRRDLIIQDAIVRNLQVMGRLSTLNSRLEAAHYNVSMRQLV